MHRTIYEHRKIVPSLSPKASHPDLIYKNLENIVVYRKESNISKYPTFLYIPGTAFVASETGYTNFICNYIAQLSDFQVIAIKHKLAPEYKPHDIVNKLYCVIKLLLDPKNNNFLNIDRTKVVIGGYSSGATFATLIAIKAKKDGLLISYQILISPVTDLSRSIRINSKYQELENKDHIITERFVEWFLNLYLPNSINRQDPKISPYWTPKNKLINLSPTYLIFGEFDRFRSDTELYGENLTSAKVPTFKIMFEKENHGLLWENPQVTRTLSAELKYLFKPKPIERPIVKNHESQEQQPTKPRLLL